MIKPTMLVAAAVLATACGFGSVSTGPVQHETANIDLDSSDKARIDLRMSAGELRVGSGSTKLAEADFTYNVAAGSRTSRITPAR